ncbi:ferredoxin--NADP reductase [Xanthobacter wiegelii]|uniref:ferredoxin--NADP reductase n=1 Tax=Xanthobacter wiegelii TaxID=3119913 RepID=UPI00372C4706
MAHSVAKPALARAAPPANAPAKPKTFSSETVLSVKRWTERLFSFTLSRDSSFRFENGQFVMIGLEVEGRPLLRAYSIASANYEDHLEFLSIVVPDGPLTSRLQHIAPGDRVLVGKKPTGTLVTDSLLSGRNLYLLSTGTGLAPFLSLARAPEVYDKFEKIVVVHGCRQVSEFAFRDLLGGGLATHPYLGELADAQLLYYPTCTREPFVHQGRVTELIEGGRLMSDLGLPALDPDRDRAMICGSEAMLADTVRILQSRGFVEGGSAAPASYVVEKAFAER